MAYGNALAVLADPTRRKVFERLRAGPRPVNVLAAGLPVSRPAVSQHLKALKDAGLVDERSEGVRRIYSLRREGLMELREWLDSFWTDALEAARPWRRQETHSESFDGAAPRRALARDCGRRHRDQRRHHHALGAAASPGDALADQRAVEAGRRDEIGGRRPL